VHGGGCFHPKLYLFASENSVWIATGSFNLTDTGFKRNIEAVAVVEFQRDRLGSDEATFLGEIANFLRAAFCESNPLIEPASECLRITVTDILSSPVFREAESIHSARSSNCIFLSSLGGSLLEQICRVAGVQTFKRIEVLSPFFDDDASAIRRLKKISQKLVLHIPAKKSLLPAELFETESDLRKIPVFTVACVKDNVPRFCHAKLYRFHGQNDSWSFLTSANLSLPGMVNGGFPRNVEIGVLYRETKSGAFPGIGYRQPWGACPPVIKVALLLEHP